MDLEGVRNNPILSGLTITMVINHVSVRHGMILQHYKQAMAWRMALHLFGELDHRGLRRDAVNWGLRIACEAGVTREGVEASEG